MSAAAAKQNYGLHLFFGVLTAAAIVGFSLLGRWQWHRAEEKRVLARAFAAGMQAAPRALGSSPLAGLQRYAHVAAHGRYDGSRQFLLDNISRDGRAGYEVLTPFTLDDGRTVVVNRGWLPQPGGGRERLPDVAMGTTAESGISITARVDELPVTGLASGRAPPTSDDRWPKLTSFPFTPELSTALRRPLETRQLLLDAAEPDGYRRDWQPASAGFGPERHLSYAVQWWSLALLALVIYVYMFVRSQRD